jgi:hypothetical protein
MEMQMNEKKLGVAVLTTSGRWPETGFHKIEDTEKVRVVLDDAAKHLKLTGTTGWIATLAGSTTALNQDESFKDNDVKSGDVVLDYGPSHGGGGAGRA